MRAEDNGTSVDRRMLVSIRRLAIMQNLQAGLARAYTGMVATVSIGERWERKRKNVK